MPDHRPPHRRSRRRRRRRLRGRRLHRQHLRQRLPLHIGRRHTLHALLDAQELDARASTGTVYWEGLSELRDAQDRRIGLGYLEMTGYAGRLRL